MVLLHNACARGIAAMQQALLGTTLRGFEPERFQFEFEFESSIPDSGHLMSKDFTLATHSLMVSPGSIWNGWYPHNISKSMHPAAHTHAADASTTSLLARTLVMPEPHSLKDGTGCRMFLLEAEPSDAGAGRCCRKAFLALSAWGACIGAGRGSDEGGRKGEGRSNTTVSACAALAWAISSLSAREPPDVFSRGHADRMGEVCR